MYTFPHSQTDYARLKNIYIILFRLQAQPTNHTPPVVANTRVSGYVPAKLFVAGIQNVRTRVPASKIAVKAGATVAATNSL